MSALSNAVATIEHPEYDPEYVDLSAHIEAIASDLRALRNEVDYRIENGAESGGHLEYVRDVLDRILS